MPITEKTIVSFGPANVIAETANNLVFGTFGADLVGISGAASGVIFTSNSTSSGDADTSPAGGATQTDIEINSSNRYLTGGAPIDITLTFPVGHGAIDVDIYCDVDGNFTGQDNMTGSAIGATTVSETRGIIAGTNIGSNNPTGEFFSLSNVSPDGANQIVFRVTNDDAGTTGFNGLVIRPTAVAGPVLSAPQAVGVSDTSVTPGATTDTVSGTLYAVVVPTADPAPSVAQIIAGTNSSDVLAPSSSAPIGSATQFMSAISGLTAGTTYRVYIAQNDGVDDSPSAVNVEFSTLAATTQTTFNLVDELDAPVVDESYDYIIYSDWNGTNEASGTFTPVSGVATITGLLLVAGAYFILLRKTASNTFISASNITVS